MANFRVAPPPARGSVAVVGQNWFAEVRLNSFRRMVGAYAQRLLWPPVCLLRCPKLMSVCMSVTTHV